MGLPQYQHRLTIEEYLALEKETDNKYEYHDGEVYAMAGGTPTHSLIANNGRNSTKYLIKGQTLFYVQQRFARCDFPKQIRLS
jgi:Uma2 family endonuclease